MRTTTYRAEFFTAADYAHRDFKARSPDEALQSARQFYEDNLVELDFRSYDDNAGLDQIQIWDSRRGAPATWQSDAYRLRKAAPKLLDALLSIYQHDRQFAGIEDPETMLCRIKDKARAAIAMAMLPPA
jgi:hypothetical protein